MGGYGFLNGGKNSSSTVCDRNMQKNRKTDLKKTGIAPVVKHSRRTLNGPYGPDGRLYFFESILSILSIWSTRRRGCFSTERAAAKINICSSFISGNKTLKNILSFLIGFENSQEAPADVKFPDGMSTLENAVER